MVAFGVVRAALGGELRRMVDLDGVGGEGDWLDDFTSLTCFERSVMCDDVLAVSGAHSGGASHASAAAGTIRNERAHAGWPPQCSPHAREVAAFVVFSARDDMRRGVSCVYMYSTVHS